MQRIFIASIRLSIVGAIEREDSQVKLFRSRSRRRHRLHLQFDTMQIRCIYELNKLNNLVTICHWFWPVTPVRF